MASFKDKTGRVWELGLTVNDLKRVLSLTTVNLAHIGEPRTPASKMPLMTELWNDPLLFSDVLYAMCKPQADAANLDAVAFDALLEGDTLAAAFDAFWEALKHFFMARRPDVAAAIDRQNREIVKKVKANIARVETAEISTATDSSSSTPPSPASTPGQEPSSS